ncbi:MAG: amino acid adenylation domain-containing protein, partial [Acidobacteriota bacterium]
MNEALEPQPIGIAGEICVGGAGLARGYLNRAELTAERFIANPFASESGKLLYRSGDLGRYLPNGDIEYLGRIDQQVKLRGFRIELGEIEALLNEYRSVRSAHLLLREDRLGDKRLVAYVVPEAPDLFSTSELRSYLKEKLPEYMVPSAFITLNELPLTPNGKIDKDALPSPDTSRPDLNEVFAPPTTETEKILAEIWKEVLGLENIGINDNFFALGGDSIRSIQIRSRTLESGFDFSIQQLFQYQTIYALAKVLINADSDLKQKSSGSFSLISAEERAKLPENIEDAYPLTALQAGMLFHSEYYHESGIYHDIFNLHLRIPFDHQSFCTAIEQILSCHPILRTSFDLNTFSEPLQLVHRSVSLPLEVEDLRHLSFDQQEAIINAWVETKKASKIDWKQPPLIRFHIYRRTDETLQFILSFHHAILDGWSVAVLLTDFFNLYLNLRKGESINLSLPSSSYRDFVYLERQTTESRECKEYWSEKLSESTVTMLPRFTSHQQLNSEQKVESYQLSLPSAVYEGIKKISFETQVPIKTVLLAAHIRLLSQLCGQSNIRTGLVSNGRLEETDGERVLGLFLNTVPFCFSFENGTWADLIRRTFQAEQEMLPYRRYPLVEMQKSYGREKLFDTAFNFTHFHAYQGLVENSEIELLDWRFFEATNFTLVASFGIDPFSSGIVLTLEYDTTVLSEYYIKMIGDYYLRTISALAFSPHTPYQLSSLLSEEEQQRILVEWNNTSRNYPKDRCIHELFEEQVERSPNAVAVTFQQESLSYAELNQRANQLAHYLRKLGIGPESIVAVCMQRSVELIVALFAILKSGAAYLPLDPTYPQERLSFMLADSQADLLLSYSGLSIKPMQTLLLKTIYLDRDWSLISDYSVENQVNISEPENLAYCIYTSGSTGRPKAVSVSHHSLNNLVQWHRHCYQIRETDRATQLAGTGFDASVWEIWPYLSAGASLHIVSDEIRTEPSKLKQWLIEKAITISFLPTPIAEIMVKEQWPAQSKLRAILTGGDKLHSYPSNRLPMQLINHYGPTESTVVATSGEVSEQVECIWPPIGRPIANTQVYILDRCLEPTPMGIAGELYIGGDGLARGYLNHAELTADRFIPNPYSSEAGQRLYRTGDLVRYLPNGEIEYLGRIDQQVKVRGFRIELGEIETVLMEQSAIEQAVVIAREDQPSRKRLIAYIVTKQQLDSSELRQYLKDRLP